MPDPIDGELDKSVETSVLKPTPIFQAIGIIRGIVDLGKEFNTVTIDGTEYRLITRKRLVTLGLTKEIEVTGKTQRLIVYPKLIHFPNREQRHVIAFQLVGFDRERFKENISEELEDNEFKISGLWQFIPVCSNPCISVFRNFSAERLEFIKQAEPARKVKFMKASHIPLLWKDAPINPFRFNPKLEKEQQGRAVFVTLKAKFLPGRDIFGFVALTGLPTDSPPRFLKASKDDKARVKFADGKKISKNISENIIRENITPKKTQPTVPSPIRKTKQQIESNIQKPVLKKKNE